MTELEFISLSERIRGKLMALVRRFNRAAAWDGETEDIVQDALVTLWQLSEKGYPVRDAEALAVKLTKTRCVERYRKQHIRFVPLEDQPLSGSYSATLDTDRMDIETIRGIVQRDLTGSQRQLLALRNEDGLSLDEIAAVTGKPKASVKTTISVARKQMLEQLKRLL